MKAKRKRKQPKVNLPLRYASIAAVFVALCLIYAVILAVVQYKGWKNPPFIEDKNIKTVTVAGLRGEIYDRNGKLLVGNSTSYDLIYEYGAMPNTYKEINAELLAISKAIAATGSADKVSADYFALEGTYPNLSFKADIYNSESDLYFYYHNRILLDNGLKKDMSAEDLVSYYIKKYKIDPDVYSDAQVTTLLRYWYNMERVRFGAYQSYTVASDVSQDLINYIEESSVSGATFTIMTERVYTYPGVASHILGQVGKISAETAEYYSELGYPMNALVGKSGCEEAFEQYLHGQDGKMVIKYDDDGTIIEKYYEVEPISGNDIYLTIDIDLQIAAEEGLAQNIADIQGCGAGALSAIDPNTGAVLALVSYPTYDLTRFGDQAYIDSLNANENNPWLNRALNGVYAPGSTYKIGVALAALEQKAINVNTSFTCHQVYPHHHNPTCLGYHNAVNVIDAIRESCNIFFYYVGEQMGLENINTYTSALGLGQKTGIELSEKAGSIAGPQFSESWGVGGDISGAIGQSDHGYTPLQLSVYMSTVVNGGSRYRAHLLDSVRTFYTGDVIYSKTPEVLNTVSFSQDTYDILIEGMRQVVEGSSTLTYNFRGLSVTVGGKTGTAEVDGQRANALFSAFAPLDAPEIVVSCIIEEGESGSRASAAVADVMKAYFEKKEN